jgi:hypothetical protein
MVDLRYNMTGVSGGYSELVIGANTFADGFLGLIILLAFSTMLFFVISKFTNDVKSAFTSSAFISLIAGYGLQGFGILPLIYLLIYIAIVLIGIVLMYKVE